MSGHPPPKKEAPGLPPSARPNNAESDLTRRLVRRQPLEVERQ
jgi:hypothetical protein